MKNKNKVTKKIDKFIKKSSFTHPSEFGKKCELCGAKKESRIYYRPINGEYLKICDDCWNKLEEEKRKKK